MKINSGKIDRIEVKLYSRTVAQNIVDSKSKSQHPKRFVSRASIYK